MCASATPIDVLIVGQGLAGSILAWHLLQAGQRVLVIDDHWRQSASAVAAGLVNPVRGKRLLLAEEINQCLPYAHQFYRQLEQQCKRQLFVDMDMLRLFKDEQQQQYFAQRRQDPVYQSYFKAFDRQHRYASQLDMPHGATWQQGTGYLLTTGLLDGMAEQLEQQHSLQRQAFDYNEVQLRDGKVQWRHYQAQHCVFCEGYQAISNPWFDWLPWQPAKGDILTIESEQASVEHIINRGNWLIPIGANRYKTGATHDWNLDSTQPNPAAQQQLLQSCKALFIQPPDCKVVNHETGVRPATRDKQPFIGFHPQHQQLLMFNGFGAHGSLMMPFYASQLSRVLQNEGSLPKSVDVQRYYPS
ncbi:MAG: FAD-dependent oxidoreductase [Chromatiales bacterium]|jgi:glycine/D-amino acid oxidase-like deaminating enzyme